MDALVWIIAVPVGLALAALRWKLNARAHEVGKRHQLDPGPARLTLGLGLSAAFVIGGVLSLVLPADPWAAGEDGGRHGIPIGVYGCVLLVGGVLFAGSIIKNRNTPMDRSSSRR